MILTIVPGAGFTFETSCLLQGLADDFEVVFLKTTYGGEPGQDGLPAGDWYPVRPYPTLTSPSRLEALRTSCDAFLATVRVLMRRPIDLVLVVGTSHAAPMLLAARLLGCPTVFVESITRVDQLSRTGRLVARLGLASRLFVQWPGLQRLNPDTSLGTIL